MKLIIIIIIIININKIIFVNIKKNNIKLNLNQLIAMSQMRILNADQTIKSLKDYVSSILKILEINNFLGIGT